MEKLAGLVTNCVVPHSVDIFLECFRAKLVTTNLAWFEWERQM